MITRFTYRSKPTFVEAVRWNGHNLGDLEVFFGSEEAFLENIRPEELLHLRAGVDGAQGWVPVPKGHWIVRQPGKMNDHWPVDPDYFASKYLPI